MKRSRRGIVFLIFVLISLTAWSNDLTCDKLSLNLDEEKSIQFPEIKGWKLLEEYPVYYPYNLWDYINGAADAYLSYEFEKLYIAEYIKGKNRSIKVEVYQHKSPVFAYGIYSQERSRNYHFIPLGMQGYSEESLVHYVQDKYYIKIDSESGKSGSDKDILFIAQEVSETLGGEKKLPGTISSFPQENRIQFSDKFISKDFLGHEFLSEVFTTEYSVDDNNFSMFLIQRENPAECKKILGDYYMFVHKQGEPDEGYQVIHDQYNGKIMMIWEDIYIWGVFNLEDEKLGMKYLELIKKKM
jgi:hypothetical protein